jgi:molybdopterin molybdotransferase
MIRVAEALSHILGDVQPLGLEKVHILNALGRVIGEDIHASRDIPPKDNSAMDGYAIRAVDSLEAGPTNPVRLRIVEDIPAGSVPRKTIGPGEAARIMTGAPLPVGADAIVRMEDTTRDGEWVTISAPSRAGHDIRMAGEDVKGGDVVIPKGELLRPAEIGMMATLGRSFIYVHQRPVVAVISTGDELVDIDEEPSPWKIINSNGYSNMSQVADCGAIPIYIGIARDKKEDLAEKFNAALRADVIVSSGGVSLGDYDFVKDVIQEPGNRMHFWQVAMRPGKPLVYGRVHGKPFFGLPGNPVSSMVSFEQFVRPALLKMMGHVNLYRQTIRVILGEDIAKTPGLTHFVRACVDWHDGRYRIVTTGDQGSGILKSMVKANGLIVLPEDATAVRKGDEVTVQLIDHSLCMTSEPQYL